MGTWATWTFTRFERVKVGVYSTCKQGLEAYPTQGITLLISPQWRTDTRQSRGGKAQYGSFLWVVRFRCSTCCHGCQFPPLPSPLGFIYGAYFFGPANGGLDRDQNRS
jgi:hypothetical protein